MQFHRLFTPWSRCDNRDPANCRDSRASMLRVGLIEIRPEEFVALCGGRRLTLAPRELALLTELARRNGRIVSREELYTSVWGRPFRREDRSVDVYVRKLRAKLARV